LSLSGQAAANSSLFGTLSKPAVGLAGTLDGAATVSGALTTEIPLAGTLGGVATAAATVSTEGAPLAVALTGVATVSGRLSCWSYVLPELGAYLQQTLGLTPGTNLFYGLLPTTPALAVALYEETGDEPQATFGAPVAWESPHVLVAVRGPDYATARTQIERVYQALLRVGNQTLPGAFYLDVEVLSTPRFDGRDVAGRPVLVFDCIALKTLSKI
jgi:hypothetical protein